MSVDMDRGNMEPISIPKVLLNSGNKMPFIGFGTSAIPNPSDEELVSICFEAIKAGYRNFDTAALYGTEKPLGQAVVKALELGLIKSRDELFITSKLWCNSAHSDLVLPALKDTLRMLGLEYVDLYLVHWPVRLKPEIDGYTFSKEDMLPFDIQNTWKAMEECSMLGFAKSIGVCNFSCYKLSILLQHATIPPAVNQGDLDQTDMANKMISDVADPDQKRVSAYFAKLWRFVEMNVSWQQQKMLKFCEEKGIHLSAWSPLGGKGAFWGSPSVMESPILENIATAKGKSIAQVALRWVYEQGASPIVKSFNTERARQNLGIFDWELKENDLALIQKIPQNRAFSGDFFVSPNGPYKSIEEIWDGEDEA